MQYKTFIKFQLLKIITSSGKVKTIQPNWASGYELRTLQFEHAVIELLKASKNQIKTAQLMRCGLNIVNRIMHLSAERGMKRRNYSQVTFEHLSINEKSFKKGHITSRYSVTQLQDVLDIENDRTKESCKKLFEKSLTTEQLGEVGAISMDIQKAYMQTAQQILPNIAIVHDRFHLVKYINEAIDKVRRREVKEYQELKMIFPLLCPKTYLLIRQPMHRILTYKKPGIRSKMSSRTSINSEPLISKAFIVSG